MIVRIQSGNVIMTNEMGHYKWTLYSNGDAVSAYLNENNDVLVTKENGTVEIRDQRGNYKWTIAHDNANDARFHNEGVVVYLRNGSIELKDMRGNFKRRL